MFYCYIIFSLHSHPLFLAKHGVLLVLFYIMRQRVSFCQQIPMILISQITPGMTNFEEMRQGGVSIYVTNTFPHTQLRLQTSLHAMACTVRIGHVRLSICSLYLPPTDSLEYTDLEGLIDQLPEPLLLCTDATSRHKMWGSDRCDRQGLIWE